MTSAVRCLDEDTVLAFVSGGLDEERAAAVDGHLRGCADCRALVAAGMHALHDAAAPPAATAAPRRLVPGLYVGRYEIRSVSGEGGMGSVYAAWDSGLRRMVALKLLRPDIAQARLLREARAMARLSHPNVVAVYDVGVYEGQVFLAMEYVDGRTLDRWLAESAPSPADIVRAFVAAGRGLAAAHAAGLVHGDFKPGNVFVGSDGRVRVGDFGLASWRSDHGDDATTAVGARGDDAAADRRHIAGTPGYLAPELLGGRGCDARSDQFAFCVALYEALWRRHPFAADGVSRSDVAALGARLLRGERATPPADAGVPRALWQAIARGLAIDPAMRFASIDALSAALVRALERRPSSRRRWLRLAVRVAVLAAVGLAAGASIALLHAAR